jgi:anti-sigma factor RsiW
MNPGLTCREAARLLFAALDGALPEPDRLTLQAHIAVCEACERVHGQTRIMQSALAAWRRYPNEAEPPA